MKKICVLVCLLILGGCALFYPVNANQLKGASKSAVQKKLGEPSVVRTEWPYQMWTYAKVDCSILIYFDAGDTVQAIDFAGSCLHL